MSQHSLLRNSAAAVTAPKHKATLQHAHVQLQQQHSTSHGTDAAQIPWVVRTQLNSQTRCLLPACAVAMWPGRHGVCATPFRNNRGNAGAGALLQACSPAEHAGPKGAVSAAQQMARRCGKLGNIMHNQSASECTTPAQKVLLCKGRLPAPLPRECSTQPGYSRQWHKQDSRHVPKLCTLPV